MTWTRCIVVFAATLLATVLETTTGATAQPCVWIDEKDQEGEKTESLHPFPSLVDDLDACKRLCRTEEGCAVVSFSEGKCLIFDSVPTKRPLKGAVLSQCANLTCTWNKDSNRGGTQTERARATITYRLLECQGVCSEDDRCIAIDFNGFLCQLYYTIPTKHVVQGKDFYERKCEVNKPDVPAPTLASTPAPRPVCTRIGQRCLSTATCNPRTKSCECPHGTHGDGALACVPLDNMLCTVDRDPHVHTWNQVVTSVDLPCWYSVTEFESSTCSVKVKAQNELTPDGLFFVTAVHVTLSVEPEVIPPGPVLPREYFVSRNLTDQAKGENPWPGPGTETVEGVKVVKSWDADNKAAVLSLPACGVQVKFRPHVPGQHPQVDRPGVSVSVPKNATFPRAADRSVCGHPDDDEASYAAFRRRVGLRSKDLATLFIVLVLSDQAELQEPDSTCAAMGAMYEKVTTELRQAAATNLCGPILAHRPILRCLQNNLRRPENVFLACLTWAAEQDTDACENYLTAVKDCQPTDLMMHIGCDVNLLSPTAAVY